MKRLWLIPVCLLLLAAPVCAATLHDTDPDTLRELAWKVATDTEIDAFVALSVIFENSSITSQADYDQALDIAQIALGDDSDQRLFGIPNYMDWLEDEAARGDAHKQCLLGLAYLSDDSGRVSLTDGFKWLEAAAAQGYAPAMYARALYAMPQMEYDTARDYLLKAAARDYVPAMYALGVFYNSASGISPDRHAFAGAHPLLKSDPPYRNIQKAAQWWNEAAQHGDADALAELAVLYTAIGKNAEAFAYVSKAAARDQLFAQGLLGAFYQFGTGTAVDKVSAYQWYLLALAGGYNFMAEQIEDNLTVLENEMSAEQIDMAWHLADTWQSAHRPGTSLSRE